MSGPSAAPATGHPAGGICWVDLGVDDVDGAAAFYAAVLGWQVAPPDRSGYRIASVDGHAVAALGPADAPGPPYWTAYAGTGDIVATQGAAAAAGGAVVVPAARAGDAGLAAVLRDPAGAPLSLWQPDAHPGTWLAQRHGCLAGVDLRSDRPDAHLDFLRAVLGWERHGNELRCGDRTVSRVVPPHDPRRPPSPWLVRFHVDDRPSALRLAVSRGGVPVGAQDGLLLDPSGALVAFS
jgi:predicted enzyme related to lactoylglutathione lyase